jgi:hypothetical protein
MLTRIWLTYKQHRFETIAILVVSLGLTAATLIEAYRLSAMNVPLTCLQNWQGNYVSSSPGPVDAATLHCNELAQSFFNLQNSMDMGLVQLMLLLLPLIAGIILGAPLVAKEIEQGTAPLSWALCGSRRRWLLGKVLAGVLLLVPLMLAVGLAANVLEGARNPGLNVYAAFDNYLGRGVIDIFWALAAFAGTFALGTILGRTLPAVILALVVCFFARGAWDAGMTHFVLTPFAVQQVQQTQQQGSVIYYGPGGSGNVDLYVYSKTFIDGKEVTQDQANAWYEKNIVCVQAPEQTFSTFPAASSSPGASSSPDALATPDNTKMGDNGGPCQGPEIDQSHFPQQVLYVLPGPWYWQTIALESGLLLLGSLFFGALAMVWVDRRRPY